MLHLLFDAAEGLADAAGSAVAQGLGQENDRGLLAFLDVGGELGPPDGWGSGRRVVQFLSDKAPVDLRTRLQA